LSAIQDAISANAPLKKHPIVIRGVIPLFFVRFYLVFLMGRDRRISTQRVEAERRKGMDILVSMLFLMLLLFPILVIGLIILYFIKSSMGFDFFPDRHFIDFIKF